VSAVSSFVYVGSELELFAHVTNWKSYFAARIRSHLGDEVLEAGAGLGATTRILCTRPHRRWVCLEPDAQLTATLQATLAAGQLPECCQARVGTLSDLDGADLFDSILYIDVLEHIREDRAELASAAAHLRPGGKVIVLSPAHQWLFTPFDQAIGHWRRYDKRMLKEITPPELRPLRIAYLDAVGMLASMGNRYVLGSGMPSRRQLWVWDKLMVPLSRVVDPLLGYTVGKSILAIWQKD
jgi:SAM-dependent methyltransferase